VAKNAVSMGYNPTEEPRVINADEDADEDVLCAEDFAVKLPSE
jgi:hypothetical protein